LEIKPPLSADAKKLTAEQIVFLVNQSHRIVGQVDLRSQEPDLILKKPTQLDRGNSVFFLIIDARGPSILTIDPESVTLPDKSDLSKVFAEKLEQSEIASDVKKFKPRIKV
jgi:hypothetical protein